MRTYLFFCLFSVCASTVLADLGVSVKQASGVTTTKAVDVFQLQLDDGTPLGPATETQRPDVIGPKTPVGVLMLSHDKPLSDVLLNLRCATAKPEQIEPGVYVIRQPGKHTVEVNAISQDPLRWDDETVTVTVGPAPPGPGPVPPGPTPGPAPIDGPGLRVLMIREASATLPQPIADVMMAPEVRAFLSANCVKVDGQPDWRMIDPDDTFTDPNHRFAKALKRPRASLPWLIVSNGSGGYEGPFPATVQAMLDLLRSFLPQAIPHHVETLPTPDPIIYPVSVPEYSIPFTDGFLQREFSFCPTCKVSP